MCGVGKPLTPEECVICGIETEYDIFDHIDNSSAAPSIPWGSSAFSNDDFISSILSNSSSIVI